jgi:hypothetical protein
MRLIKGYAMVHEFYSSSKSHKSYSANTRPLEKVTTLASRSVNHCS